MTSNFDVILKTETSIPESGTQLAPSLFLSYLLLLFSPQSTLLSLHSQRIQTTDPLGNAESHLGLLNVDQFQISSCVYFQMYFPCEKDMNLGDLEYRT